MGNRKITTAHHPVFSKIFFNGVNGYLGRVYYSLHDAKTPVAISVAAVVLNIILNFCLIGPGGFALSGDAYGI